MRLKCSRIPCDCGNPMRNQEEWAGVAMCGPWEGLGGCRAGMPPPPGRGLAQGRRPQGEVPTVRAQGAARVRGTIHPAAAQRGHLAPQDPLPHPLAPYGGGGGGRSSSEIGRRSGANRQESFRAKDDGVVTCEQLKGRRPVTEVSASAQARSSEARLYLCATHLRGRRSPPHLTPISPFTRSVSTQAPLPPKHMFSSGRIHPASSGPKKNLGPARAPGLGGPGPGPLLEPLEVGDARRPGRGRQRGGAARRVAGSGDFGCGFFPGGV